LAWAANGFASVFGSAAAIIIIAVVADFTMRLVGGIRQKEVAEEFSVGSQPQLSDL